MRHATAVIAIVIAGTASAEFRDLRVTSQGNGPCGTDKRNIVSRNQQIRVEQSSLPASTPIPLVMGNDNVEVSMGSFLTDASGRLDATVTVPSTFPIPSLVSIRGAASESLVLISAPLSVVNPSQCDMSWTLPTGCDDFDFDGICNDVDGCPEFPGNVCPAGAACGDGVDNDRDGSVDFGSDPFVNDPGCSSSSDPDERSPALPCDDGIDNDGDGTRDVQVVLRDLGPGAGVQPQRSDQSDPACASPSSPKEATQCDDSKDNDGDGAIDADGIYGSTLKDLQCRAASWDDETTVPEPKSAVATGFAVLAIALWTRCRRSLGSVRIQPSRRS